MEKQRINRASRFIKGLLSSLLILTSLNFSLFSQVVTEESNTLKFKPSSNQKLITENDIQFELLLPSLHPSDIEILEDMNQLRGERNISFLSLKKYEDPVEDGTRILISYNFKKKGSFTLLPLIVDILGETVKLEFENVEIANNPSKMIPTLVVKFSNGSTIDSDNTDIDNPIFKYNVKDKLNFTIYLQYATSLNLFNYNIPQDSIYNEIKTYDITNKNTKVSKISDDLLPIASFQWTALKEGRMALPLFKVNAVGYDGKNYDIVLPDVEINFVSKEKHQSNNTIDPFDDAFSDSFISINTENENEKKEITIEDCEKLASLYSKERHSIFSYGKAKKERIAFEEERGISSFSQTTPVAFVYLSIVLILVFGILLFFVLRKRQFFKSIALSLLLLSSVAFLIVSIGKRSTKYGISKGCTIYSIPEESAEASSEIKRGSLVVVTETTDIWYHIQQGEASGWSTKDNIIIVK